MANPFVPPSQPNTYNLNPPSDDGSQTSSNVVAWATIKSKLADPLVSWINSTLTAATSAFSGVVQGPNSSVSGNIPVFADASGKLFSDSGVSTVGLLPSGAIVPYGGVTAPAGWLLCAGQAVSRTGANANLFAALTIQTTGNTHTTTTIDGMGSTANMAAGMPISGPGIQANTTLASIVGPSSVTISLPTTTSVNGVAIVVAPYGVGDGSTTFNTPDYRGRSPFGADAMGGSAANRLGSGATGGIVSAAIVGASGGEQKHALITAELAVHNHPVSDSASFSIFSPIQTGGSATGLRQISDGGTPDTTQPVSISVSTGNAGSGNAHNVTPPALVSLMIIKL